MRKIVLLALVCLLGLPAAAAAAPARGTGDGTLSIDSGSGKVLIEARGGVIGRFDGGVVTILDLTPEDAFAPVVFGENGSTELKNGARAYHGTFRIVGGRFRVLVMADGIDLSAAGDGFVVLEADPSKRNAGTYSLDGDDCKLPRVKCKALPDVEKRFRLGDGPERRADRTP